MNEECTTCLWRDNCHPENKEDICDDYSPIDEDSSREAFYIDDLRMRAEEYEGIIEEYNS